MDSASTPERPLLDALVAPVELDRTVARRAKNTYNEARLAGPELERPLALTAHTMEAFIAQYEKRRALSPDNHVHDRLLTELHEVTARRIVTVMEKWRWL